MDNNNTEEAKGGGRAKRSEDSSASGGEAGGAAAARNSGRPSSASTLEEEERIRRRREQNTIHSRRKRERQKIEVEVLREQCAGLSARNLNLFHENKRLQRLLELGQQAVEQHHRQHGPNDPQVNPQGQGGTALAVGSAHQPNQQHLLSQQSHDQLHLDPLALQTMQLLMQHQQRQQPPPSTNQLGSFFPSFQQHEQPQPHHLPPLANQLASTLPGLLQQQLAGMLSFQQPDTETRNLQESILDPTQEWCSQALGAAHPRAPQELQATLREQLQQQQQASSAPPQSQQLLMLRQLVQLGVAPERIIAIMGQPPSETRQGQEPSRNTAAPPHAQQVIASSQQNILEMTEEQLQQEQELLLQQLLLSGVNPDQISRLTGQQQQQQAGAQEQNSQEEEPEGETDRKPPARR